MMTTDQSSAKTNTDRLKIIISPAKKMVEITDYVGQLTIPLLIDKSWALVQALRAKKYEELKELLACSEKLAIQNYERYQTMRLEAAMTPALLAYQGLQYQHLAAEALTEDQWVYLQEHLVIISGLYGVLRASDAVVPYRLEMQAKLSVGNTKQLYGYWADQLYRVIFPKKAGEQICLVNLASLEYSRAVLPYVSDEVTVIDCVFGEWQKGKVKVKSSQVKAARGEMVRYMAEAKVKDRRGLIDFAVGFNYQPELSTTEQLVFIKK